MTTHYLNNSGSRWISTNPKDMEFVLVLPNGTQKIRKAKCFEAVGNFAVLIYQYKGKQYRGIPKCWNGSETRVPGEDSRTFIFHKE